MTTYLYKCQACNKEFQMTEKDQSLTAVGKVDNKIFYEADCCCPCCKKPMIWRKTNEN